MAAGPEDHRARLLARLDALREDLDERLDLLAAAYRTARSDEHPIALAFPAPLLDFVSTALAHLEAAGHHDLVATITLLYTDSVPTALAAQLAGLDPRCPWLMRAPLPLAAMPRLCAALSRLQGALNRVAPARAPYPWERWFDTPLSLAELYPTTFFGRLQPLFGTSPEILAELGAAPPDPGAVDRLLGTAILHELMHFSPDRAPLWPPYLDEAIAGGLQVALDPGCALPNEGEALEGFLTYAQVGLALIDAVGFDAVLAAQAGAIDWDTLIPGLRLRALDLYWPAFLAAPAAHLHPDPAAPRRYADLFDPPAPSRDTVVARACLALRGASMRQTRPGRVAQAPAPAMTFDFERGLATAHPPHPGAPPNHLLHRLGGPTIALPAGADETALLTALDASGLFVASCAPPTYPPPG